MPIFGTSIIKIDKSRRHRKKLQDLDYFKAFTLDPFTIDWNDEIGFAPEYLYERGIQINEVVVFYQDDKGIKQAQDEYQRLMNNKSPKNKRRT